MTISTIENKEYKECRQELKSVLDVLRLADIASIITHHENESLSSIGVPRLKRFTEKLQKVLGREHETCTRLKNTSIYKKMKYNRQFKSLIVVDLDQASKPQGREHEHSSSEEDPQQQSEHTENIGQPALFDSMIFENQKKRKRSKKHKQRKNDRQELNRAKKDLINSLIL